VKLTVRARLTLVYGGVFVLAGLALLGAMYVLLSHELSTSVSSQTSKARDTGGELASTSSTTTTVEKVTATIRLDVLHAVIAKSALALIVVSAVAIMLGWLIAGRMLRPLHQITETARRIADAPPDGRGLHERIALSGPQDEVRKLADTFDHMLQRLDHSFDGQRRFIASASHELRTPLTLNRTLLEVALTPEDTSPQVRQLGTTLLAINDRHGRLIDGLLMLAQSEREVSERAYVDLADIVDHVVATSAGDPVKIVTETREAAVSGDPVLLEHLVRNLIENGIRHNVSDDGWVRVATATAPGGPACLEVSNSGPVVPRYEVPALFEPFRRFRTERLHSPGAGLGLSIVRSVARAHGGEVQAQARDDGGLIVTVTLPHAE
jgi:signal transduction histidine kinase